MYFKVLKETTNRIKNRVYLTHSGREKKEVRKDCSSITQSNLLEEAKKGDLAPPPKRHKKAVQTAWGGGNKSKYTYNYNKRKQTKLCY